MTLNDISSEGPIMMLLFGFNIPFAEISGISKVRVLHLGTTSEFSAPDPKQQRLTTLDYSQAWWIPAVR